MKWSSFSTRGVLCVCVSTYHYPCSFQHNGKKAKARKICLLKLIRLMYNNEKEKVVFESGIWSIQPIVNGVKVFDFPQELNKGDAHRCCLDYFDWRAAGWAWEVQQCSGREGRV